MFAIANSILWLITAIGLTAVFWQLRGHFGAEAREQRRRARSHRPVISTANRPMVRLAVDAEKSKCERKR
jgi:hypothetical protein